MADKDKTKMILRKIEITTESMRHHLFWHDAHARDEAMRLGLRELEALFDRLSEKINPPERIS